MSEKKPWKDLPDLSGTVETEFVWPTALGEQVVPFRILEPAQFVVPLTTKGDVLGADSPRIDAYPGLADWIRKADALWKTHGGSKMSLVEQIDHMKKLTQQVPTPGLRVVYAASGMHVSAALVTDPRMIIEHAVYWATVTSEAEGRFLVGILNSPSLTELVRPLMSYGKDERHVDKNVWRLQIPLYDPANDLHREIARLAKELSDEISGMTFRSTNFVTTRRDLREHLAASETGRQLNVLVEQLLDVEPAPLPGPVSADTETGLQLIRTTSGPLPLPAAEITVDVDCEFDETGTVYLWGALVARPGEPPSYTSFGSPEPEVDEIELATEFGIWLDELLDQAGKQGQTTGWFHYGQVEAFHLRRLLSPELAEKLLARSTDLLAEVVRPNFYASGGYGLKSLAPAAGATWRTQGATGADTLAWIETARAGDGAAWQQLVDYNEDDTRATMSLRTALSDANEVGWVLSADRK